MRRTLMYPIMPMLGLDLSIPSPIMERTNRSGPGKRTIFTLHKEIRKGSRYMPHQGEQEKARRRARMTDTKGPTP